MADPLPPTDSMQKSPVAVAATLVQEPGNEAENATGNTAEGTARLPLSTKNDNTPTPGPSTGQLKPPTEATESGESRHEGRTAIDPLSRHILKRTNTENMIPQKLRTGGSFEGNPGASENAPLRQRSTSSGQPGALRKDSVNNRLSKDGKDGKEGKDKKNRVSFLSRFIGNKKRDPSPEHHDDESEVVEHRIEGMDADVFSQPIGFIPRFPAPPKYIKVRVHNRKEREYDRVFLAQEINGKPTGRKERKESKAPSATVSENLVAPMKNGSAIWAMEFSKDGKYLAAGGQDKIVRVWTVLSSPEDRMAHENDEDTTKDDEPRVRLNAPVFKTKTVQEYDGHTASVLDLSWSKNNFLLSSSMDKTVRLWHVTRTECLCCFKHSDFVTSIQFHPRDDRFFLAGSLDSKLRLWSIPDKSVAYWTNVPDMVTAVTFTPDGKTAVAGCLNGLCMFYETEGLKPYTQIHVRSARGRNAKGSKITGMDAITLPPNDPNGEVKLLITSNDSRVRLYNFKDRNLEVKFRGNENTCSQIHATFSDDGRYVICGSEDRKAYIWPTATVDKEQDKRPVEVFEAHSAIVTTAILAPTKTRQLLGASGDPLYDLCNPPPVTLVERVGGSSPSSKPPTENGAPHSEITLPQAPLTQEPVKPPKPEESPAYLARSSHTNGNIIVTADYTGSIKIFRQDCAYQKRQSSWETNSAMTKKLLGRSNSVATRTSVSSVTRRDSLTKHPSTDRILSWRSSITSSTHGSLDSLKNGHQSQRTRSTSPGKSASASQTTQHSSPRHGSTPFVTTTPPISTTSLPHSLNQRPPETPAKDKDPTHLAPSDAAKENPATHVTASPSTRPPKAAYAALPMRKDDPLMLQGEQSYMYWDRAHYAAQATAIPRTPGLLEPSSFMQLERRTSVASTLSSEASLKEGDREADREGEAGLSEEEEDLKCANCGGTSFRAKRDQKLICNDCGNSA